jgi:Uma2 family endonuclease
MTLRPPLNPITADLYRQMPEGPPYYELIEGNLVLKEEPDPEEILLPPWNPVTVDFYNQLPEGPPYYELIEGHLIMSPSPSFYHQQISSRLNRLIANFLEENPLGFVATAPSDVTLNGTNVVQPDLYFVSNARRNIISEAGVNGPPDLVVEILSASNFARDRKQKRLLYDHAGVPEMWIIDPFRRQIEVHPLAAGLDASPAIIHEPDPFSPAIFSGLRIDTVQLFKPLD